MLRDYILGVDIYGSDEDLRLDERQLATQLGVSRTPIVKCWHAWHKMVWLMTTRRGVFIHRKSMTEILEMVIATLESMAARLVTQHASDDDLLVAAFRTRCCREMVHPNQ